MNVGAEQVWQINDEGVKLGSEQLGQAVSNRVITLNLTPEGDWEVQDAAEQDLKFQVPESAFARFMGHFDVEDEDDL